MHRALLVALTLLGGCAKKDRVRGLDDAGPPELTADDLALYGRRVAVVVGISDYADDSLDLDFARADAEAVASLLEGSYGFDVVRLLDAEATRERILGAFDDLTSLQEQDALMVFWGGHGTTETLPNGDQLGYLVPFDGSMDASELITSSLSMENLRTTIGRRIGAKHKFLVVDACYSGLLATRDVTLPPHTAEYLKQITDADAYQVLTAGRADQTVLDGGANGHSVFTGRLLKRLQSVEDYITAEELSIDIRRKVQSDAHRRNHRQTPLYGRIFGEGDFVFVPGTAPLSEGAPVVTPLDREVPDASVDRLSSLLSNLHMRLMLLEGQKRTTLERLDLFLGDPDPESYERVLSYANPQLEDVLDVQSSWEEALEELAVENVELTREIAWDILRITGVLREIVALAPGGAAGQLEQVEAWTTELRDLQGALERHQQALMKQMAPQ